MWKRNPRPLNQARWRCFRPFKTSPHFLFSIAPCAFKRTVVTTHFWVNVGQKVATKEHRRQAKGLIEELESRVHAGPPIGSSEIVSAKEFLRQNDFSPSSDYFSRLVQIQSRLGNRTDASPAPLTKKNYGGEANGSWLQLQSAYDHVILSKCYNGEFNRKRGRIKISHRFNQQGRADFVELKFLASLHPCLNGELRKLIAVKGYQSLRKDWHAAEAFVLPVLPQELVFLFEDIFRADRSELLSWLINIGHQMMNDLVQALQSNSVNGHADQARSDRDQLPLESIRTDSIAIPIIERAARLNAAVELIDPKTIVVRYVGH